MPILWLFVRFLRKAGGFAGPPALQWVYSILAFGRGQGKRRAPAVQTLFGMHISKGPLLKLSPQGGPSQTKETAAGGL